MGVRLERGGERGFLLCDNDGCHERSAFYRVLPDDPTGSVCAQAEHEEGWSSTWGFLTDVVGLLVYCPRCRGGDVLTAEVRTADPT
jgi:hypothetical protein